MLTLAIALLLTVGAPGGSGPVPAPVVSVESDTAADNLLAAKLLALSDDRARIDACFDLAWKDGEDPAVRAAALRRLGRTSARLLAERIIARIGSQPPAVKAGMLVLVRDFYYQLGGAHPLLDYTIAEQIRLRDPVVAEAAIGTAAAMRIREAYLPMREVASRTGDPLREKALQGIADLGDGRAVEFFTGLLKTGDAPRAEIYNALARIGRPASFFLKIQLDSPDAETRALALDALLSIANSEDLSALYAYIQKYPPQGDLRTRIYQTIASVEAKQADRPLGEN